MIGSGVPIAVQGKTAIDFIGNVWLEGPFVMIGGGRSSSDVTLSFPLMKELPAKFTAAQTIVFPLSFLLVSFIVSTVSPPSTADAWYLPLDVPGIIIVLFPSMLQNIVGSGLPDEVQVKLATAPLSTFTEFGLSITDGGSKNKKKSYFSNFSIICETFKNVTYRIQ